MASFVFNNFKKRFLQGQVPSNDTWHFIPVNSTFKDVFENDDFKLEEYRTVNDFTCANSGAFYAQYTNDAIQYNNNKKPYDEFSYKIDSLSGSTLLDGCKVTKQWEKVIDEDDFSNKPMFITRDNFSNFNQHYNKCIKDNKDIQSYLDKGGFYFIRSKDELTWFANRSNNGNNSIIGVFGDNIEGHIDGDPIGADEKNPFEGILDGNGYTLENITIECTNIDNGIVGVLGKNGIVKNFCIKNTKDVENLQCERQINLNHIKTDARDINAGLLVGRNYGTITNIKADELNEFRFSGFVPEVYSVTNKSDENTWSDGKVRKKFDEMNNNYYYLNSWCINSPGNICPYVGYFAEGYYGEDQWGAARYIPNYVVSTDTNEIDRMLPDHSSELLSFSESNVIQIDDNANLSSISYVPMNSFVWDGTDYVPNNAIKCNDINKWKTDENTSAEQLEQIKNLATLPVYMGLDNNGYYTSRIVNGSLGVSGNRNSEDQDNSFGWSGAVCYNTNLIQDMYGPDTRPSGIYCPSAYCQTSLRMHPMARAAYNVGIIVGHNCGNISNVAIKATMKNTSNFVGFIGGLAGKQSDGTINKCDIDINNEFNYDGTDNSYNVIYKGTPLLPSSLRNKFNNYYSSSTSAEIAPEDCMLEYAFSAFYDSDETVNTATDITDDCISYKLRPIFIAGGMFGRYVPSYKESCDKNASFTTTNGCRVNDCKIVYADNFESTNNFGSTSASYKRIENAMGAIIGKVDYETNGVGINENQITQNAAMIMNNCLVHVNSTVGETVKHRTYMNNGTELVFNNTEYINDTTKNVGIYELKYNSCNTIALTYVNSANVPDVKNKKDDEKTVTGKDTGYLFSTDIPFMTNVMSGGRDASFWSNSNLSNALADGYEYNIGLNYPHGYNKRNIAQYLVQMYNSVTNVDPVIVLYDDFVNTWPDFNTNRQNDNWPLNYLHSRKAHRRPGDVFQTLVSDVYALTSNVPSDIHGTGDKNTDKGPAIYGMEIQGIQNTFDGYTFISAASSGEMPAYSTQDSYYSNAFLDNATGIYHYELYNKDKGVYQSPKVYVKNKLVYKSPFFIPSNYNSENYRMGENENDNVTVNNSLQYNTNDISLNFDEVLDLSINYNKEKVDRYFYYTYNETSSDLIEYNKLQSINNVLINHEDVRYNAENILGGNGRDDVIGFELSYNIKIPSGRKTPERSATSSYYGLGEYYTPSEIREKLNETDTFDSTAISSNSAFGGLLVVDSSGRNVMFLDNVNNAPLTGNPISYPMPLSNNINEMKILEVK